MNSHDIERFIDLAVAVNRCVARIESDAASGRTPPPAENLGVDWKSRLYTVDAFILGASLEPVDPGSADTHAIR